MNLDLDIAKMEYWEEEGEEHKEKPNPSSKAKYHQAVVKATYEKALKAIEATKLHC